MFDLYSELKNKTFIIMEIGCNFENDFQRAKEMIRAAAEAGASAVKFQTFIPEKLASKHAQKFWEIEGCPGETQLDEFKEMPHLTLAQYQELKKEADKAGILMFSTPSDEESADLLEQLDVPLYKISSMDITHLPLLEHIAKKGKPIIMSTGASTIKEISDAVHIIKSTADVQIALLHCISNYPTKDENANLRMISHLKEEFPELPVGYSDHTLPENCEGLFTAAVALGAQIIEKHFTFDNKRPGYDHEISVDYKGLKNLVVQIRRTEKALGSKFKKPLDVEVKARLHARRSLVAAQNLSAGTVLTSQMIAIKRPGTGLQPEELDVILGKTLKIAVAEDEILTPEMFN